jgi:thiamine-phosphate diphosphorylase
MPFRLMLVTDRSLVPPGALPALVEQAVAGGVDAVQLREKDLPSEELIALGKDLRAVTRGRALLIVNGTIEQAMACEADGVHLPETANLPARQAGPPAPLLLGRSVHSVEAAERGDAEGMNYLVLGTIYPSRSHPDGRSGGQTLIRDVCGAVSCPVIAIGGITEDNVSGVLRAGASGVAVISAILAKPDVRAAAARIAHAIAGARGASIGERA